MCAELVFCCPDVHFSVLHEPRRLSVNARAVKIALISRAPEHRLVCALNEPKAVMFTARTEDPAPYGAGSTEDDLIIERAKQILERRIRSTPILGSPALVKDFLQISAAKHHDKEVFAVLFMDAQNRVIDFIEVFHGTLTQTSVYPREVLKLALIKGASAVILTHNHPSGSLEPSRADELLTQTLKSALDLVDVRVLDHIITSHEGTVSFAERGIL